METNNEKTLGLEKMLPKAEDRTLVNLALVEDTPQEGEEVVEEVEHVDPETFDVLAFAEKEMDLAGSGIHPTNILIKNSSRYLSILYRFGGQESRKVLIPRKYFRKIAKKFNWHPRALVLLQQCNLLQATHQHQPLRDKRRPLFHPANEVSPQ